MDKNKTEKEKLFKWACENFSEDRTEKIFTPIKKDSDSYYEKVENREYIREYEPDTAVDVKQELSSLWGTDEVFEQAKLICTVAGMKNKNPESQKKADSTVKNKKQLKPFIYQF